MEILAADLAASAVAASAAEEPVEAGRFQRDKAECPCFLIELMI
jgi:hypothetical protein